MEDILPPKFCPMTLIDSGAESRQRSPFRAMQAISIHSLDSDPVQRYSSSILDWTDGVEMEIGAPVVQGVEARIPPGTAIGMEIQGENAVLRYTSVVIRRVRSPLPSLVVEWPRGGEPLQRRDAFRVPISLSVVLTLPDEVEEGDRRVVGKTADLSVGGVRVITERPIPEGQRAELRIEGPRSEPMLLQGRVVRGGEDQVASGKVRYWVGVQFTEVSPADRRDLTRFLFEIQREMRTRAS